MFLFLLKLTFLLCAGFCHTMLYVKYISIKNTCNKDVYKNGKIK